MSETPGELEQRLKRLEEEAAKLREALAANAPTEPATPPVESEHSTPEPNAPSAEPQELTASQVEEAEKLLRHYHLETQRNNHEFARRYLEEAIEKAANYTVVVECQADDLLRAGKRQEAMKLYKRAFELDKNNVSAEKKHANLVFSSQAAGAGLLLSVEESVASAKSATILSTMLPGLGQMVSGQVVKGGVIIAIWVCLIAAIILIPNGMQGIVGMVSGHSRDVNPAIFLVLGGAFVVWIGSLVDMQTVARGREALQRREKAAHPKPPVDLPFE